MPFGDRSGDKNDSRYCGVDTEDDVPRFWALNLSQAFDFVVAPLILYGAAEFEGCTRKILYKALLLISLHSPPMDKRDHGMDSIKGAIDDFVATNITPMGAY